MLSFVSLMLWWEAPQTHAQDVLANMRACAGERDDARRLACYDRQFQSVAEIPADVSAAPAGPAASSAGPGVSSPQERFGMTGELERKQGVQPPRLEKLNGRVAAISHKLRGEAVIRLDNGQVWEEAEAGSDLQLSPGDAVTIRRGMLGSFWLSTAKKSGLRVRRVR